MRLVIDVSGVSGAVYYSESGAASGSDIKVADITFDATHKAGEGTKTTKSGAFYVKGT